MQTTLPVLTILYTQDTPAIAFAASELKKYLSQMDPTVEIRLSSDARKESPTIQLGLFSDLHLPVPPADNPQMDDHLRISIHQGQGTIAGLNPRAVLLGVYRFLEEAGCRFLRPGKDGEYVPATRIEAMHVSIESAPTYRHRGICIEGAVSFEHMLDNIDWAPKVGFNSYFLEFMLPFTFFERWYSHKGNPLLPAEPLTTDQVRAFMTALEKEIVRRGLAYHNPGHGWTCESLGIPGLGWFPYTESLPEGAEALMAEIHGERKLFHGIPLNTNLCYSNPRAREAIVDYAVKYMREKPYINFLHVWLADSSNNFCECPNCRETLPADHLFMLLNELDAAFTEAGISARIVFPVYLELLWPPREQVLKNQQRFLLLFCPISRSYSKPYDIDLEGIHIPEYQRNKITLPRAIRENLAFLKAWEGKFGGDRFTYEYYYMWDCYLDPGYCETARVLHEDIRRLHSVGLNGIMSDQTQRSFFPTAFGMHVMARTLWDPTIDYDQLADWYFQSDFGEDGPVVRGYLEKLSVLFDPPYLRGERQPSSDTSHTWVTGSGQDGRDDIAATKLAQIPDVIDAFRSTIEKNLHHPVACRARSWQILAHHAQFSLLLAQALFERAKGNLKEARGCWEQAQAYIQHNEVDLHPVLDIFELISVLGSRFG